MTWTTKPPPGTPLDPTVSLNTDIGGAYPLNEGAGNSVGDATGHGANLTVNAGSTWVTTPNPGIQCTGTNAGCGAFLPTALYMPWPITLVWGLVFTAQIAGQTQRLGGCNGSVSGWCWSALLHMSALFLEADANAGTAGSSQTINTGYDPPYNSYMTIGLEFNSAHVLTYINGALQTTQNATLGTGPAYGSNAIIALGSNASDGSDSQCAFYHFHWWYRSLAPSEHFQMAANPWVLYEPPATLAATEHGDSAAWAASASAAFGSPGQLTATEAADHARWYAGAFPAGATRHRPRWVPPIRRPHR